MTNMRTASLGQSAHLIVGWTDLWNGDLAQSERICALTVGIHFGGRAIGELGDTVVTPGDLARLIGGFRASRPGLTYRVVEARTTEQWGYCVWDASRGDLQVGGIDTFQFGNGRITKVCSVTAERPMSHW